MIDVDQHESGGDGTPPEKKGKKGRKDKTKTADAEKPKVDTKEKTIDNF